MQREDYVEATLVLEGELRERELFEVAEKLSWLMHRGCRWVVLDFFDVPHIDYRGVRPLLAEVTAFRKAGGDVKLTGISPYLDKILRVGGAYGVFDLYPRPKDAWAGIAAQRRRARPSDSAGRAWRGCLVAGVAAYRPALCAPTLH